MATKKLPVKDAIKAINTGFDTWQQVLDYLIENAEATGMELVKQPLEHAKQLVEVYRKGFTQSIKESK